MKLGHNPHRRSREPDVPVGLKVGLELDHLRWLILVQNLGATCYANAFLQVALYPIPLYEVLMYIC